MRCEASESCAGHAASAAGEPPPECAVAATTPPSAASAASALPKRRTGGFVEEVQVLGVDCDRDFVAELQLDMRRERRDEVRPRADDGLVVVREDLFLFGGFGLDVARLHVEVRHRLAAERLDQFDARPDLRKIVATLRRVEVAGAEPDD